MIDVIRDDGVLRGVIKHDRGTRKTTETEEEDGQKCSCIIVFSVYLM